MDARQQPSGSISVALCTYNGERHLGPLLESLSAQERHPAELVVCDDRSKDGTVPVLESFAARAPFPVRIHVNERNLGTTANFDRAIGLCTSDLIALCDQDDVWLPKKLLRASEVFEADPRIGFTFSDAELVDDDLAPLGRRLWDSVGFNERRREIAANGDLVGLLIEYTFVTGTTMVIRSELRELLLPIPNGWIHDAWISLIASFVRPYRMIDEPLLLYRIHAEQQIGVPKAAEPQGVQKVGVWLKAAPEGFKLRQGDVFRQQRRARAMLYDQAAERIESSAKDYISGSEAGWQPHADEALTAMREHARHLHARGELPDNRLRRVRGVGREFRAGRYRRYSAGVLSALKDIIN